MSMTSMSNDRHTQDFQLVSRLLDLPDSSWLEMVPHEQRFLVRGQHLYHQGDAAHEVYVLVDGTLKAYRISREGDESVVRFCYSGELLWSDGSESEYRSMSVVALERSRVFAITFANLQRMMSRFPSVQRRCYASLSRLIGEEQNFIGMLSRSHAERRVAFLLAQLSRHRCQHGFDACSFSVPMSRNDIGSYLGLRVETVSRAFSKLEADGIVQVEGKRVQILAPDNLHGLAGVDVEAIRPDRVILS